MARFVAATSSSSDSVGFWTTLTWCRPSSAGRTRLASRNRRRTRRGPARRSASSELRPCDLLFSVPPRRGLWRSGTSHPSNDWARSRDDRLVGCHEGSRSCNQEPARRTAAFIQWHASSAARRRAARLAAAGPAPPRPCALGTGRCCGGGTAVRQSRCSCLRSGGRRARSRAARVAGRVDGQATECLLDPGPSRVEVSTRHR